MPHGPDRRRHVLWQVTRTFIGTGFQLCRHAGLLVTGCDRLRSSCRHSLGLATATAIAPAREANGVMVAEVQVS
ncbi:MAG: hypothetical protein M3Y41_06755 [Pseudomonadota bacterium]|nr:hypothetical protein [Pseudomonadota bacterium]